MTRGCWPVFITATIPRRGKGGGLGAWGRRGVRVGARVGVQFRIGVWVGFQMWVRVGVRVGFDENVPRQRRPNGAGRWVREKIQRWVYSGKGWSGSNGGGRKNQRNILRRRRGRRRRRRRCEGRQKIPLILPCAPALPTLLRSGRRPQICFRRTSPPSSLLGKKFEYFDNAHTMRRSKTTTSNKTTMRKTMKTLAADGKKLSKSGGGVGLYWKWRQ